MSVQLPLISIVTPCLNRRQFIEEAIRSVLHQDYPHVEHIIMDGGSTDGTLEVVNGYPHLHVVSEPDHGVYDALNKGVRLAQGEVIGHLNSDDIYAENVLVEVARRFEADPELDAVYGGAIVFEKQADGTSKVLARYLADPEIALSLPNITVGVPIINARFFHKRVYDRVGLYDMRYRIAGDREFLLRVAQAKPKSEHLGCLAYQYRQHPGSLSISRERAQMRRILDEHLSIAERYLRTDGTSSELSRSCRLWHATETTEGVVLALREARYLEAGRFMMRGWRHNLWWPVAFASQVLPRFARFALRRRHGQA